MDRTSRRTFLALSAGVGSLTGFAAVRANGVAAVAATASEGIIREAGQARAKSLCDRIAAAEIDAAIELAIENVVGEGFTDALPRQFEADLLGDERLRQRLFSQVRQTLTDGRFDQTTVAGVELISLAKRTPFSVRRIAILQPADAILYLSLTILAAPRIEIRRVAKERMRILSYRYAPSAGRLFDVDCSYGRFVEICNDRLLEHPAGTVATADIECFYERISLRRLSDNLLACSLDEELVTRITGLLDYWQENGGRSGLPIGSNASRILAEAVLVEVDEALDAAGVDFIRFVDDYRLFAPNPETAHAWLALLADRIEGIGLTLNPDKTGLVSGDGSPTPNVSTDSVVPSQNTDDPPQQDESDPRKQPIRPDDSPPRGPDADPANPGPAPDILNPSGNNSSLTYFRPPERQRFELRMIDLDDLRRALIEDTPMKPNFIVRRFIQAAFEQNHAEAMAAFPRLIVKYPHFTAYCVSGLIDWADQLTPPLRARLATDFESLLADGLAFRDHVAMQVIRLLGNRAYGRPEPIMAFIGKLKDRSNSYIARVAIDGLRSVGTGEHLSELFHSYRLFGEWAKRAIVMWAAEKNVLTEAGRACLANPDDPFAEAAMSRVGRAGRRATERG